MGNLVAAEWIKYRRSFTRRFLLITPAFLGAMVILQQWLMPELDRTWTLLVQSMANWWVVLFVPIGVGLLAGLTAAHEERSGTWRVLRLRAVAPARLFLAKLIVLMLHLLISELIFGGFCLLAGLVTASGPIPWSDLVVATFIPWLGALPIMALQLWLATAWGSSLSIVVAVLGFLGGVVAAARDLWLYVPYAYGTRMITPLLRVQPNGIPLEAGDPLLDLHVVPLGITLSLTTCAVIAAVGSIWFHRREVQ